MIRTFGDVLAGSDRRLLITSGVGMGSPGPGQLSREDVLNRNHPNPRRLSEITGEEVLATGVSVGVVRLPQVHDALKQGLISPLIDLAREKGVAAYVDDGSNRWCAAAVEDVPKLYVLALDRHQPDARWHAVDEEAIPMRTIAEAIGTELAMPVAALSPEQVAAHFGWMTPFAGLDMPVSGAATRERLGWRPAGPTLLEVLARMDYSRPLERQRSLRIIVATRRATASRSGILDTATGGAAAGGQAASLRVPPAGQTYVSAEAPKASIQPGFRCRNALGDRRQTAA